VQCCIVVAGSVVDLDVRRQAGCLCWVHVLLQSNALSSAWGGCCRATFLLRFDVVLKAAIAPMVWGIAMQLLGSYWASKFLCPTSPCKP